jgi:hypothetical protein
MEDKDIEDYFRGLSLGKLREWKRRVNGMMRDIREAKLRARLARVVAEKEVRFDGFKD